MSEGTNTSGPWTRLRDASRAVLERWDSGESFDEDESARNEVAWELMGALAGASAGTDDTSARLADAAPDLLEAAKRAEAILGEYRRFRRVSMPKAYPDQVDTADALAAAIAKTEGREP